MKINIAFKLLFIDTMHDSIEENCATSSGMLYEMDLIYDSGEQILCTSSCPCDANPEDWPEEEQDGMVTSTLGQNTLVDCPVDGLTDYDKDHYVPLLTALETTFDCAGMCTVPKYFLFSEVDK